MSEFARHLVLCWAVLKTITGPSIITTRNWRARKREREKERDRERERLTDKKTETERKTKTN